MSIQFHGKRYHRKMQRFWLGSHLVIIALSDATQVLAEATWAWAPTVEEEAVGCAGEITGGVVVRESVLDFDQVKKKLRVLRH